MRYCCVAFLIALLAASPVKSHDTRTFALNMSKGVNDIILTMPKSQHVEIRRAVSLRLVQCALLYRFFKNRPQIKPETGERFRAVGAGYEETAAFLYPGDSNSLERDTREVLDELQVIQQDRRKLFDLASNCQDFSEPRLVPRAIERVMLH